MLILKICPIHNRKLYLGIYFSNLLGCILLNQVRTSRLTRLEDILARGLLNISPHNIVMLTTAVPFTTKFGVVKVIYVENLKLVYDKDFRQ